MSKKIIPPTKILLQMALLFISYTLKGRLSWMEESWRKYEKNANTIAFKSYAQQLLRLIRIRLHLVDFGDRTVETLTLSFQRLQSSHADALTLNSRSIDLLQELRRTRPSILQNRPTRWAYWFLPPSSSFSPPHSSNHIKNTLLQVPWEMPCSPSDPIL